MIFLTPAGSLSVHLSLDDDDDDDEDEELFKSLSWTLVFRCYLLSVMSSALA